MINKSSLNHFRCETCKFSKFKRNVYDDGVIIDVFCEIRDDWFALYNENDSSPYHITGCASHSDMVELKNIIYKLGGVLMCVKTENTDEFMDYVKTVLDDTNKFLNSVYGDNNVDG